MVDRKEQRVFVVGNGMTRFLKPGRGGPDYHELSEVAIRRALRDAGIEFDKVQQAYVGYVNGDSCAGQRAIYTVGMTGIPIFNVNNYGCTPLPGFCLCHDEPLQESRFLHFAQLHLWRKGQFVEAIVLSHLHGRLRFHGMQ